MRSSPAGIEERRAFSDSAKNEFMWFYSYQPLAYLELMRPTSDTELKLRLEFSQWVSKFMDGDGFTALWELYSRHGIEPGCTVMRLTWWKIQDMQFAQLLHGKRLIHSLQTVKERKRLSKKLRKRADTLEVDDRIFPRLAKLLISVRLTIGFVPIPTNKAFPLESSFDNAPRMIEYARRVAEWIEQLPAPQKGPRRDFESFHRAVSLCAIFKGYSGRPLYQFVFRILRGAFPKQFSAGEKTTAVKRIQRALYERGDKELPVTVVPPEIKKAVQDHQRRYLHQRSRHLW